MCHSKVIIVVRVYMRPPVHDLIVKMRPGGLAGIPGRAYVFPALYNIALLYINLVHMGISGPVTETVVNDKILPVTVALYLHHFHYTVCRRIDGIADIACEVHTFMVCGTA